MAQVFGKYAHFYDSLYDDKDYTAESDYLHRLFKKHSDIKVKSILDLGCGTGGHAVILARRHYRVTGLDRSGAMLKIAQAKAKTSRLLIDFHRADMRSFDLKKRYDAIISMFAAMGYQTRTEDFLNTLRCARKHLYPGGIFIFDVWFGPAVLVQGPEDRKKIVNAQKNKIIRQSQAILDLRQNIITVNFKVKEICGHRLVAQIKERHLMRFFFIPEIGYLAKEAGFRTEIIYAFMTERENITEKDWNICVLLK